MFKNKFYGLAVLVGLVLALLLVVAQFPTARPVAKNVPIAMVNEDTGVRGEQIADKMTNIKSLGKGSQATTIKWIDVKSEADLKKAMDHQNFYGAIVIPKNFSENLQAVPKTGQPANLKIVVNQAKNATLANNVQVMLNGMVNKMSAKMGQQMLGQIQQQQIPSQTIQTNAITNPVVAKTQITHSVKDKNSASSAYFQPLWMASLFATFLIYTASKAMTFTKQRQIWQLRFGQMAIIAGIAIVIGVVTTWLVASILNYTYDDFWKMAGFSMIASAAFMYIMYGLEMWIGFAALPIIALLMLFSAPLMQLAPEMIPHVYHDWLLPWLPIRFLLDGAKSIVYYDGSLLNQDTWRLIGVGFTGIILVILSIFKDWWLTKRTMTH